MATPIFELASYSSDYAGIMGAKLVMVVNDPDTTISIN